MLRYRFVAALLLATSALSPLGAFAADKLHGVALVIGESDYEGLQKLDNPKRDARAMDDLLDNLGFAVDRVLDGDAKKMRDQIADFVAEAKDADVALVYYSGHGVEIGGENYLVPTDTDLATPESAGESLISVDDLLAELAKTVPVTIVLLDACRTNSFPAGQLIELPGSDTPEPIDGPGLEAVKGPVPIGRRDVPADSLGMVIGFAASPGQPALDGDPGGNSPYAAALIKHFAAGGYSLGDLMTMVSEEVYLKTRAQQLPWVNSSLRRVLTFGAPVEEQAGDDAEIRDGRRQLLLTIAGAPDTTRHYVETVAKSEGVPLDALYGMLKVLGVDTSAGEQDLERQLLEGAKKLKDFLATQPGNVRTDPELVRLAGLADKAQQEGAIDLALKFRVAASQRADALDAAVDETEANLEADRLQIGATYADHAKTAVLNFDFKSASLMWGKAFEQVARWDDALAFDYKWQEASALADLGEYGGNNEALTKAIAVFAEAESLTEKGSDDWAAIRNDLGTTLEILGERQGDDATLRKAAEAFEDALTVRTLDHSPLDWAGTQGNLGVVLMNLGQREQGTDTLVAARDAFAASLDGFPRDSAPLDWGKAQGNLGNVLHMLGDRTGDVSLYDQAADAHRLSLEELRREIVPLDWATAENNFGNALARIGDQQEGVETLNEAVAAFRLALEERRRDRVPVAWGVSMDSLASTLASIGVREDGTATLEEAVNTFEQALEERTRERSPLDWASTERNMGIAAKKIGERTEGLEWFDRAIAAYRMALEEYTIERVPLDFAQTQGVLGIVLLARAGRSGDRDDLLAAREAYAAALDIYGQVSEDMAGYFNGKLDEIDQLLGN
ncbi:MAG: caspase family protein [Devosia sp.]